MFPTTIYLSHLILGWPLFGCHGNSQCGNAKHPQVYYFIPVSYDSRMCYIGFSRPGLRIRLLLLLSLPIANTVCELGLNITLQPGGELGIDCNSKATVHVTSAIHTFEDISSPQNLSSYAYY